MAAVASFVHAQIAVVLIRDAAGATLARLPVKGSGASGTAVATGRAASFQALGANGQAVATGVGLTLNTPAIVAGASVTVQVEVRVS